MNRYILNILLALSFALVSQANSGELKFSKTNYVQNEKIEVSYFDTQSWFKDKGPLLYIYTFTGGSITPFCFNVNSLKSADGVYQYSFNIPSDALFIIFKVGRKTKYDVNSGELWDLIIRSSDSLDLKDANYLAGLSYLTGTNNYGNRIPDFKKVKKYFQKELELYKSNLKAEIALLSFRYEIGEVDKPDFEEDLQSILSTSRISSDNESEITVILKALRLLGKTERAEEIESKFAAYNPKSKIAIEIEYEKLSKIGDFESFLNRSLNFIRKYPESEYHEKILLAVIQSYVQVNKIPELVNVFIGNDFKNSEVYYQLTDNLLHNEKFKIGLSDSDRIALAERLLEMGYSHSLNIRIKDNLTSNTEFEENIMRNSLRYNSLKSNININKGKNNETDSLQLQIYELSEFADQNTIKEMLQLYYNKYDYVKTLFLSELLYFNDLFVNNLDTLNYLSYNKLYTNDKYNNYTDSLYKIKEIQTQVEIKQSMVKKKVEPPTLKTLDGSPLSTKMFQGRVLLFYTFAYWCDECWDMFNYIESLYQKYRENENVLIFPVILWNKEKENINETKNFLEKNKLDVPIYFDLLNETYKNLSITGVPSIIIIDQESNMVSRFDGITNLDETFSKIKYILDYNLNVINE
jgi:thiol-disulfide isomerase/thioredoxin